MGPESLASTKLAANRNFSRFDCDFVVAEVMSNYLTTDGLKFFSLLPEAPLRPEARGICHICHMVNPAPPFLKIGYLKQMIVD